MTCNVQFRFAVVLIWVLAACSHEGPPSVSIPHESDTSAGTSTTIQPPKTPGSQALNTTGTGTETEDDDGIDSELYARFAKLTHEESIEILASQLPKNSLGLPSLSPVAKRLSESCDSGLSPDDETRLNERLSEAYVAFFRGGLSSQTLTAQVQSLMREGEGRKLSDDDKRAFEGVQARLALGSFRARILTGLLSGERMGRSELQILEKLGVDADRFEESAKKEAVKLQDSFDPLKKAGFHFSSARGWTLETNVASLEAKDQIFVQSALSLFFGPGLARMTFDKKRRQALAVGNIVITPVRENPATRKDYVLVMKREFYVQAVKDLLEDFRRDAKIFSDSAKQRATYGNLMSGALHKEHGLDGRTAPEIAAEESDKRLVHAVTRLQRELGVSSEMISELTDIQKQLARYDSAELDRGLAKVDAARAFTIAAPLVPVALYLAPVAAAGTAGTMTAATWVGTGTATLTAIAPAVQMTVVSMASVPLIFAMGSSLGRATIDAKIADKPFWCQLREEAFVSGLEAGAMGSKLSLIPVGGQLLAGASSGLTGSAAVGSRAKSIIDTAVALYFLKGAVQAGATGVAECRALLHDTGHLEESAPQDVELLKALASQALKSCLQAGVDIGFAISGSLRMSEAARKAWAKRAEASNIAERGATGDGPGDRSRPRTVTEEPDMTAAAAATPESEIPRLNSELFENLDREVLDEPSSGRRAGLSRGEAQSVIDGINSDVVAGNSHAYDPEGNISFCFGRALATHLEVLAAKVSRNSIRKIWIVGSMKLGTKSWAHHVATMVKATDGSWWVLDNLIGEPLTPKDWASRWIDSHHSNAPETTPRVFVSEAKRWGAAWPSPYHPRNLKDPFYNGFFVNYLDRFRARRQTSAAQRPSPHGN